MIYSLSFHNNLVITFLQVFNNAPLDVNVLIVAERSQDLTQDALYLSLCIEKFSFPQETQLGVLGIRDNWQNNFRDKGKLTK